MSIHKLHRQRIRKKILDSGIDNLPPHEVLELLLFFSIPRRDTNEIAHNLIKEFGSFTGVLNASYSDLLKVNGIGENSATHITLLKSFFRYYSNNLKDTNKIFLNSTESCANFLLPKFLGRTKEITALLFLDSKCSLIQDTMLSEGTVNAASVNIRQIIELSIRYNASAVVMAHNHPGGIALPSREDLITTTQIFNALRTINIHLVDHFVIADDEAVSMRDSGILDNIFT